MNASTQQLVANALKARKATIRIMKAQSQIKRALEASQAETALAYSTLDVHTRIEVRGGRMTIEEARALQMSTQNLNDEIHSNESGPR